jgi:hypothetical protein
VGVSFHFESNFCREEKRMSREKRFDWMFLGAMLVLLGWITASPVRVVAQDYPQKDQGESAIYQSGQTPVNSLALIDASAFYSAGGPDICSVINTILTSSSEFNCGGQNGKGVIIDARGIGALVPSGVLQCSSNPVDLSGCGSTLPGDRLAATVLLPAATIQIQKTWVLPSNARIIGEGQNLTTLQACTTSLGCPFTGTALGEAGPGGVGFSRFTTSPNAANWGVGSASPAGQCTTNNYGSLYSRSAAGTPLLWVCENSGSGPTWTKIY